MRDIEQLVREFLSDSENAEFKHRAGPIRVDRVITKERSEPRRKGSIRFVSGPATFDSRLGPQLVHKEVYEALEVQNSFGNRLRNAVGAIQRLFISER